MSLCACCCVFYFIDASWLLTPGAFGTLLINVPRSFAEGMAKSITDSLDAAWFGNLEEGEADEDVVQTPPKKRGRAEPKSTQKSKAKAKAKASPKTKAKAVKRTVVKKCRGCNRKLQPGECAPNWPGCVKCKRALDNITKQASRQGVKAQEFVAECRQDDAKLQQMLASYHDLCSEATDEGASCCGRKRGTWSLVQYQERVTAASGIVKDCLGEMMFERLYIEHAQTTRGGRLREEEAQAQWLKFMTLIKNKSPDVMYDHAGPNGQVRVWIKTADLMKFRSTYFKEKEILCVGDSVKKGTAADVDKFRGEIMQNHDRNMGFQEVAQALTRTENTFGGNDGFLLNVLDLLPDVDGEEDDEEIGEDGAKPDGAPREADSVWVDRDRVVSSNVRFFTNQLKAFEDKALEQLKKQMVAKDELLAELPDSARDDFAGELRILEVRLEAIDLCFQQKNPEKAMPAMHQCPESLNPKLPSQS